MTKTGKKGEWVTGVPYCPQEAARDQAQEFVAMVAGLLISGEKDAEGNPFEEDAFEAQAVLHELIATARQIMKQEEKP
jgi:hypothetical protein